MILSNRQAHYLIQRLEQAVKALDQVVRLTIGQTGMPRPSASRNWNVRLRSVTTHSRRCTASSFCKEYTS